MTNAMTDNRFPYVLIASTAGTVISLASTWMLASLSYTPLIGA